MELVPQVDEREEQWEEREHAFVAVLHVEHIFDFRSFERKRLTPLGAVI
jgi:hypothetical protein